MISVALGQKLPLVATHSRRNEESRVSAHVLHCAELGRRRRGPGTSSVVAADSAEALEATRRRQRAGRRNSVNVSSGAGGFSPFFPKIPRFGRIAMGNRSAEMTRSVIHKRRSHSAFRISSKSAVEDPFPIISQIFPLSTERIDRIPPSREGEGLSMFTRLAQIPLRPIGSELTTT
jgi:hypothetical protein